MVFYLWSHDYVTALRLFEGLRDRRLRDLWFAIVKVSELVELRVPEPVEGPVII